MELLLSQFSESVLDTGTIQEFIIKINLRRWVEDLLFVKIEDLSIKDSIAVLEKEIKSIRKNPKYLSITEDSNFPDLQSYGFFIQVNSMEVLTEMKETKPFFKQEKSKQESKGQKYDFHKSLQEFVDGIVDFECMRLFEDKLSDLKRLIQPSKNIGKDTLSVKIAWSGTPGEFGSIFNMLIQNGYIEKLADLKTTVKYLESVFEVQNEDFEIVDSDYLYKCFGEKKKQYLPGEIKIPKSDNYSKLTN